jgi:hypothetical protein
VHPSWHKLNLIRDYPGEDLFIFDADMWCLKEWNPAQWPKGDDVIALAPDHNHNTNVRIESQLYHIPPGGYYNTGLLIVRPGAKELFAEAKKVHPVYGSWLEQTSTVSAIHRMKIPHTVMPRQYNGMLPIAMPAREVAGSGVVVAHFAGRKDPPQLMAMFDALERLA